ncbi:hypothetical protein ACEUAY_00315 [Aeromonas veronii]|jgi:tetrahydromethanopterin S-methyltransferase subunit G|uniref:hypothetical protein n=1 Tax=Aeromonas TaxID=642 RepID=UPI00111966B4|nr:hypothetical protein [Aeromonas veronii]MCO4170245.1 hypothetical protein [Aeromonas veronii]NJI25813.1 hypothetical protein [Aeromonas veronii]TNI15171.1 hypothetical protein CF106_02300 [Aeromonas veronii]
MKIPDSPTGRRARGRPSEIEAYRGKSAAELAITKEEQMMVRRSCYHTVMSRLDTVRDVLDGAVEWSPNQTRLFTALLNKVLPDLKVSQATIEHTHSRPDQLTREELERMVAESRAIEGELTGRKIG